MKVGSVHEVAIERLVHGGAGLAHVEGRAVLVPFSAPGERVRVRVTRSSPRVAHAEIVELLAPSPLRRAPPCAHFGACGGCQLQHLSQAAQLEAKVGIVRDCLRRIGGVVWDSPIEIRAGPELGYRSRADLHVAGGRVGYFRPRSHDLLEVKDCPILVPALQKELARLVPGAGDRLSMTAGDEGEVVFGEGTVRQRIGGVDYRFGAGSFLQSNRRLVDELVREAVGDARGAVALDLYAGAGLFALQLARSFATVLAVEENGEAVDLGRDNARANRIENVFWAHARVETWITAQRERMPRTECVLLDPPRAGAGEDAVLAIAALRPAEIVYVSCDPATLARDLRAFRERGFEITSLVALDLFPQTAHVETVTRLRAASHLPA